MAALALTIALRHHRRLFGLGRLVPSIAPSVRDAISAVALAAL